MICPAVSKIVSNECFRLRWRRLFAPSSEFSGEGLASAYEVRDCVRTHEGNDRLALASCGLPTTGASATNGFATSGDSNPSSTVGGTISSTLVKRPLIQKYRQNRSIRRVARQIVTAQLFGKIGCLIDRIAPERNGSATERPRDEAVPLALSDGSPFHHDRDGCEAAESVHEPGFNAWRRASQIM